MGVIATDAAVPPGVGGATVSEAAPPHAITPRTIAIAPWRNELRHGLKVRTTSRNSARAHIGSTRRKAKGDLSKLDSVAVSKRPRLASIRKRIVVDKNRICC